MFGFKTILIADSSTYAALDVAQAIEDCEGCVAGPIATMSEALAVFGSGTVAGAIVDCELAEAPKLIMWLADTGVPLVVQTSLPLPEALESLNGKLSVLMRPVDPHTVLEALANEISKAKAAP